MRPISRRAAVLGSLSVAGAALGLATRHRSTGSEGEGQPPQRRFQSVSAPSHEALVEAAKREGQLTIYSTANAQRQRDIAQAFTKKYGIKVAIYRLVWSELDHKVYAEKMAGVQACDVACGNNPVAFQDFAERGWLQSISDEERTTEADWPPDYWNGYFATAVVNFQGISFNTERVPASRFPQSWDELLDPFWTGNILLLDPRTGIQAQLMYDLLLKAKGVEFLKKLGAQGDLISSGPPALQAVGAGASLAFCPAIPPTFEAAAATGMPLKIVYPELKSYSAVVIAAIADCPHPNAAKLYVDFTMTAEGQAQLNRHGYSPLAGVPGLRPLPGGIVPPDYEHAAAHAREIIAALT